MAEKIAELQQYAEERYGDHHRYFKGEYSIDGLKELMRSRSMLWRKNAFFDVFKPRAQARYLFAQKYFGEYFEGSILDVGSRDDTLKKILGKEVALTDKNNLNLPAFDWELEKLRYADSSFDTVICLDTLEHIDHLHEAFNDLLRVAKSNIIISLPNCWRKTYKYMLIKGRGSRPSYGLPPEAPLDRHRWFFNTEDVEEFFFYRSKDSKTPFVVKKVLYHLPSETRWQTVLYPVFRSVLPARFFKNVFVNTVFVLLEKPNQ